VCVFLFISYKIYKFLLRLVNFCSLFNFSENDEEKKYVARLRSSSLFSFCCSQFSIEGFFVFLLLFASLFISVHFILMCLSFSIIIAADILLIVVVVGVY
jgi:hypothetical protein